MGLVNSIAADGDVSPEEETHEGRAAFDDHFLGDQEGVQVNRQLAAVVHVPLRGTRSYVPDLHDRRLRRADSEGKEEGDEGDGAADGHRLHSDTREKLAVAGILYRWRPRRTRHL